MRIYAPCIDDRNIGGGWSPLESRVLGKAQLKLCVLGIWAVLISNYTKTISVPLKLIYFRRLTLTYQPNIIK